jgi:hypothetical protein
MRCASAIERQDAQIAMTNQIQMKSSTSRRLGGRWRGPVSQASQLAADLFSPDLFGGAKLGFGFGFDEEAADQQIAATDCYDGEPEGPFQGAERLAVFGSGFEGHGVLNLLVCPGGS